MKFIYFFIIRHMSLETYIKNAKRNFGPFLNKEYTFPLLFCREKRDFDLGHVYICTGVNDAEPSSSPNYGKMQYLGPAQLSNDEMILLYPFITCGDIRHGVIEDREKFLEQYLRVQAETLFGIEERGLGFPFPKRTIPDKPWGVMQMPRDINGKEYITKPLSIGEGPITMSPSMLEDFKTFIKDYEAKGVVEGDTGRFTIIHKGTGETIAWTSKRPDTDL